MHELIGIETDKLGNEVKVYFCKFEEMTAELTAFFSRQWAELLESRHAVRNYIPSIDGCRVIYVTIDDKIVGIRLWVWEQSNTKIILTAMDKNHRNQGLLKIIAKHYDQRLIGGNCDYSITFVHINNTAMIAAAKKTGYIPTILKMVKKY